MQIWVFDVIKQGFAAAAAHLCGMLWAIIMASLTTENASECAWYFVVFFVDTTVGVIVALYLHRVVVRAVSKRFVTNDGEPRCVLFCVSITSFVVLYHLRLQNMCLCSMSVLLKTAV